MTKNFILSLPSPDATLAVAGGKGANLNRLIETGLPVPPAILITTAAYDAFARANDLAPRIAALVGETSPDDPDSFSRASFAIRNAFAGGAMPPDVARAIQDAAGALAAPLAVRSSATAEDLPEASFAGQQDTFLNVRGEAALLDAVQRCWSSLWTARAIAYRARRGITPDAVSLAVVIQEMVPARAAGVLFTVNPVAGDENEMLVNAAWGLGEALVAGRVNPDTLVLDKATGAVKRVDVGDKTVMTAAKDGDGVADVDVPDDNRRRRVLSKTQAAELARLGRAIETCFGAPQDVEWALADGSIAVLQSWPVTGFTPAAVPGDDAWPPLLADEPRPFDLWTQADVGERWPEPVTPLTWSTWQPILNSNMRDSFLGVDEEMLDRIEWAKRAYGHVYFNEGALVYVFHEGYGMPASMVEASLTAPNRVPAERNRWRWGKVLRRGPLMGWMTFSWERNVRKFEEAFPQIDQWVDDFMARDLSESGDAVLWAESEGVWRERMLTYIEYHANATSISFSAYGMLEGLLDRWLDRKELAQALIGGLEGVIAAEIVPALWRIAQQVEDLGLGDVLLDNDPETAWARLGELPKARPLLAQIDAFLQRHGHRCMSEAEWLYPRWVEAPAQVIAQIATYLRAGETFNPAGAEVKQRRRREEATVAVKAELNPLQWAYFNWGLQRTQRFARLRDNGQHFLVKLIMPIRIIYAALGRRWAERGWLAEPDDFFFLATPEIEAVLAAGDPAEAGLDLRAVTAERRQAYEYWFTQPMPDVLGPDGEPLVEELDLADGVLSGAAASGGRIEGTARVVLSPQEASRLRPGEILVTRATDPGWTPVFSIIGGLVLEIGGQLSHGAIVAREYGLPAVVNVPEATRHIQDGDTIVVDGSNGRVYLNP